ncbi:hypothetical protein B0T18DRAFT_413679 [Schizothecium vesticola]|uniref:Uncharacterized protein n=1 Tax=Schizothecium vesticola TaxID=314040 RepID=A0AA40ENU7_9PEZI|nr:hypothetical protein B0T18DRAFT_413679 [Schizothecium vesticola]
MCDFPSLCHYSVRFQNQPRSRFIFVREHPTTPNNAPSSAHEIIIVRFHSWRRNCQNAVAQHIPSAATYITEHCSN